MLSIFRKWAIAIRRKKLSATRKQLQAHRSVEDGVKGTGESCMNCKVPLTGPFCHICGQKDSDLRRPIWVFLREILDDVFSADSRLIKSVLLLLMVPGGLTRSYSDGRRARFVPPLRLYLSISIMFFAVLWLFDILILDIKVNPKNQPPSPPVIEQQEGAEDANKQVNPPEVVAPPVTDKEANNLLDRVDVNLTGLDVLVDPSVIESAGEGGLKDEDLEAWQRKAVLRSLQTKLDDNLSEEERASLEENINQLSEQLEEAGVDPESGIFADLPYDISIQMFVKKTEDEHVGLKQEDIDKFLEGADNEYMKEAIVGFSRALKDPEKFNDLFNEWLPKTLFVMVPLFAFILRVFHWRKKQVYVHQLVFSLHFHSFLFLLLSALIVVVPTYGGANGFALFWWGASLYLIIALKVGQEQGIIRAFLKAGLVWVFYCALLLFGLAIAIFYGLRTL